MSGYKGVGIIFIRQQLRKAGEDSLAQVLKTLSNEDKEILTNCTASEWVPIESATRIAVVSADKLFADSDDPLFTMGIALAEDNLSGIYRFLVRMLTPTFLVKQAARLWGTYHQGGRVVCSLIGDNEIELRVFEYLDCPSDFRHYGAGFISQAISMTGANNVSIKLFEETNQNCWGYHVIWAAH